MTGPFDSFRRNSRKLKRRFSKKHANHSQIATVSDTSMQPHASFTSLPSSHSVPNLVSFLKRPSAKNKSSVSFDLSPDTTQEFRQNAPSRRHSVDQVGTIIDIRKKRGLSLSPPPAKSKTAFYLPTQGHVSHSHQNNASSSPESVHGLHKEKFDESTFYLPSYALQKRVFSDSSIPTSFSRTRTRPRSLIFDDLQHKPEQRTSLYQLPASHAKSTSSLATMTERNIKPSFTIPCNPRIIINDNENNKHNNSNQKHQEMMHLLNSSTTPETIPDFMLSIGFYLCNIIFSVFFYLPILIVTRFSNLSILIISFLFVIWYTNGWLWTMIPSDSNIQHIS